MYDIIPDIHGHLDKLTNRLTDLGYRFQSGAWRHPDTSRSVISLGDFIDRGPENLAVIKLVRDMIEAGSAQAVMGNHELNAIHYHTLHPITGKPLRKHTKNSTDHHLAFLKEAPIGSAEARDAIAWMKTLPLFLEEDSFRAVHACWHYDGIQKIRSINANGILTDEHFILAGGDDAALKQAVDDITKGPEIKLPDGYSFQDKNDSSRRKARIKWWPCDDITWKNITMSIPESAILPDTNVGEEVFNMIYQQEDKPVFFGHYWMFGPLHLQSKNTLCLDFSAGKNGPLISYLFDPATPEISIDNVFGHYDVQPN